MIAGLSGFLVAAARARSKKGSLGRAGAILRSQSMLRRAGRCQANSVAQNQKAELEGFDAFILDVIAGYFGMRLRLALTDFRNRSRDAKDNKRASEGGLGAS